MFLALRYFRFAVLSIVIAGCNVQNNDNSEWQKYYDEFRVTGSFLAYDLNAEKYISFNPGDIDVEKIPASTFKILNSLIALETGAIEDDTTIIKWDSVEHNYALWNADHTLRTGIKYSVVWVYQELARRIGRDRMEYYIDLVEYGNQDISGPIDSFWLNGPLEISLRGQVDFLVDLYYGNLPFSDWIMETVREIMILERSDQYILRGKTGWGFVKEHTGWFVGYVEKDSNVCFFANRIVSDTAVADFPQARIIITKKILGEMGYY